MDRREFNKNALLLGLGAKVALTDSAEAASAAGWRQRRLL